MRYEASTLNEKCYWVNNSIGAILGIFLRPISNRSSVRSYTIYFFYCFEGETLHNNSVVPIRMQEIKTAASVSCIREWSLEFLLISYKTKYAIFLYLLHHHGFSVFE